MISPESIIALKAYTGMLKSVQGALDRQGRFFYIGSEIREDGNLPAALRDAAVSVYCVRNATFHSWLLDPGTAQTGPFTFRGATLSFDDKVTLVGKLLEGSIDDDVRKALFPNGGSDATTCLVSFVSSDVLKCSGREQVAFGTSTVAESLAPKWEHFAPVLSGQLPRTLAACANGCYVIDRVDANHQVPAALQRAQALLKNLTSLDIMATTKPPPGAGTGVIYRLASNALLLGPAGYEEQLAELQRELRVAPTRERGRLPTSSSLDVSASVAEIEGDVHNITAQQVLEHGSCTVCSQSLERWCLPSRSINVWVQAERTAAYRVVMAPWFEPAAELGVTMQLDLPSLRPLRAGETALAQREQLERVVKHAVGQAVSSVPVGRSQHSLDACTTLLATALQSIFGGSGLFLADFRVHTRLFYEAHEGDTIRLPTGGLVVVPKYATETSARICALTGGMGAVGLRVTFYPWQAALNGILLK